MCGGREGGPREVLIGAFIGFAFISFRDLAIG